MMRIIYGISIIGLCAYVIEASSVIRLNSVLSYMNENVSPCDNFYDFVCGNYAKTLNENKRSSFKISRQTNEDTVRDKLHASIKNIDLTTETFRPRRLVKKFFDMCMDKETRKLQTPLSLVDIINKLHGFPIIEGYWRSWRWESNWRWENVFNEAIKLGIPTDIFWISIDAQRTNDQSLSLRLYRPVLVEYDNYYRFILMKLREDYMFNNILAEADLQALLNFKSRWSSMVYTNTSLDMDLNKARENFGNIDWDKLVDLSAYGIKVDDRFKQITVDSQEYMHIINDNLVPKRILANYQIMKFLVYALPYLHWELGGSRWKLCIDTVRQSLPHITDAIFIQDHFDKDIISDVSEMIENIKEQYEKAFNSISWLNQSARNFAIEKLETTKFIVAYPDEMLNNTLLDEFYEDYEIVEGDFLKTALRFNFLSQKRKTLRYKTSNHFYFETLSSWIDNNASNHPDRNMIRILAGYLQGIHYNKYRPKYMNYATLGRTIGHEIAHSFGKNGIWFDKNGHYESPSLHGINNHVYLRHDIISKCLVNHYNGYRYPTTNEAVNGKKTVSENMADVNGIRAAYHAYQQWVKDHEPERSLTYANFTTNQLFWISFAHAECVDFNAPEYLYRDGTHAPNDVRIKGSLSNSPEFAADFNCPISSNMNPMYKCVFD